MRIKEELGELVGEEQEFRSGESGKQGWLYGRKNPEKLQEAPNQESERKEKAQINIFKINVFFSQELSTFHRVSLLPISAEFRHIRL